MIGCVLEDVFFLFEMAILNASLGIECEKVQRVIVAQPNGLQLIQNELLDGYLELIVYDVYRGFQSNAANANPKISSFQSEKPALQ